MIKILIADDHKLLIEGLKTILEKHPNLEVVGVAKDGIEAVRLTAELHPNIILLDISMPLLNGLDAARQIHHDFPEIKIIILSMHADRKYIQEAIRIGARGYILKEAASTEVIQAIKAIQNGELFFSESVRNQVLQDYIELIRTGQNLVPSNLSNREREVLQLVAEGKSTKDIAAILNISIKTVETHRKQIMDSLKLFSVAELTKYAIREGITRLE